MEIDFIVDYGQTRDVIEVKFQNKVSGLPVAMRNFTKKYNTQKMILVTKQDFKEEDGRFYIPLPLFEFFLQANIRNWNPEQPIRFSDAQQVAEQPGI